MAPACLIGAVLGVTLLVSLPRQATLIALGAFLLAYGIYTLRQGAVSGTVSRRWAPVAGFAGGAMGTLFGIGAPPYAIYLTRRLADKGELRATLSNMVLLSTSIRALVFAAGGLMLADRLIMFALLLPFALAGLWCGNRIHGRISREQVARVISGVLMLIGLSLIVRALAQRLAASLADDLPPAREFAQVGVEPVDIGLDLRRGCARRRSRGPSCCRRRQAHCGSASTCT